MVPPTLPQLQKNNNKSHGQREDGATIQRGKGKIEESDRDEEQMNSEIDGLIGLMGWTDGLT